MPIDPSIYFNRVQPGPSAQDYANKYLMGQGQALQNQHQDMANQQVQQNMDKQQQVQSLAKKYQTAQGFDQRGFINEYASIDPMGAQQLHQKLTQEQYTTQKIRSEAQDAYLKMNDSQRKEATWHAQETVKALDAVGNAPPEQREQLWDLAAQKLEPSLVGKYQQVLPQLPVIRAGAMTWQQVVDEDKANKKAGEYSGFHPTRSGEVVQTNAKGEVRALPGIQAPLQSALVNVGVGSPVQGVDEAGNSVFFQPRKGGGPAEVIPNVTPPPKAAAAGKKVDPAKLTAIIGQAKRLIPLAPGSYMGAGTASVQRVFGSSDERTQSQAKLQALQASLMMNMPRMEGPQSNTDVALYREQAGRIGDPTVPAGDKMAALQVIEELNNQYASLNPVAAPEPKNPSAVKIDKATYDAAVSKFGQKAVDKKIGSGAWVKGF